MGDYSNYWQAGSHGYWGFREAKQCIWGFGLREISLVYRIAGFFDTFQSA